MKHACLTFQNNSTSLTQEGAVFRSFKIVLNGEFQEKGKKSNYNLKVMITNYVFKLKP